MLCYLHHLSFKLDPIVLATSLTAFAFEWFVSIPELMFSYIFWRVFFLWNQVADFIYQQMDLSTPMASWFCYSCSNLVSSCSTQFCVTFSPFLGLFYVVCASPWGTSAVSFLLALCLSLVTLWLFLRWVQYPIVAYFQCHSFFLVLFIFCWMMTLLILSSTTLNFLSSSLCSNTCVDNYTQ